MHLTNYAINKTSDAFVKNDGMDDSGSKRSLSSILDYLEEHEKNFYRDRMLD